MGIKIARLAVHKAKGGLNNAEPKEPTVTRLEVVAIRKEQEQE
jgi:hypothetical protein